MHIACHAQQIIHCAPPAVFALLVDPLRFPAMFSGYGPIAAIRAITLDAPLQVGTLRRVHNADGSFLSERITVLEPPTRHAYTLGGFRAPFSWLVAQGRADWSIGACAAGAQVRWDYAFTPATAWTYPLAAVLLRVFMTGAMRRCLRNMARALATPAAELQATV